MRYNKFDFGRQMDHGVSNWGRGRGTYSEVMSCDYCDSAHVLSKRERERERELVPSQSILLLLLGMHVAGRLLCLCIRLLTNTRKKKRRMKANYILFWCFFLEKSTGKFIYQQFHQSRSTAESGVKWFLTGNTGPVSHSTSDYLRDKFIPRNV